MAAVSEYAFGVVLGLLAVILFYLNSLQPHSPPPQKPSPPPSPPLTPRDPELPNEPYDEEAIISSMKTIYDLLLDLQYLKSEEIIFPSPSGHSVNETLCQVLNLDERVESLMRRLPHPRDIETSEDFHFIAETRCPVYVDEEDIKQGRDPEMDGPEDIRLDYILPSDIALTVGKRYGKSLVLDTKENTIRTIDYYDGPPIHESMERPDDQSHYRNYLPEPALEVLRRIAHEYRSLATIPRRYECSLSRWDRKKHPELKRILIEDYGWPDNFKKDAWAEDCERIWYEIDHRFEAPVEESEI